MTRQEQITEVLGIFQEAKERGDDPLRALIQVLLQRLLEEEMTAHLGAEAYERTAGRRGHRNGYKPRQLTTRVGTLELLVPEDREGTFRTELFERYQRSEKALVLALVQMYLQGVSTRKVQRITERLCGRRIKRSQVSALTADLEAHVQAWRSRPLQGAYPYLVIDARYEAVRQGPHVVSQAVLTVVGVSEDGYREVLGTYMGDSESEATWGEVLADLKARGLAGVRYVVSDAHEGLVAAVRRHLQGVLWQRCQVHLWIVNLNIRQCRIRSDSQNGNVYFIGHCMQQAYVRSLNIRCRSTCWTSRSWWETGDWTLRSMVDTITGIGMASCAAGTKLETNGLWSLDGT